MNKLLVFFSCCLTVGISVAQMPETNVFLISYSWNDNDFIANDIKQVNNGKGYNNQPSFSQDCNKVFYTSNVLDSMQTDLFVYDVVKKKSQRLSNNYLSEYSPMIRPNFLSGLSHVRVEEDKKQHLRFYESDYSNSFNLIRCSDSIGYYIWVDSSNLGLIILNNGLEFHTYQLGDSYTKLIAQNVGRFINYDKKSNNYLLLKKDSASLAINYFNVKTGEIQKSIQSLSDCEDYAIDVNSDIYGGRDGKLFKYFNNQWLQVADLSTQIGSFYRMSFCNCGKHLCVVSYNGKKP
ncbi:MAG: hypothetical protein ACKPAD_10650 [Bacteroidota bacterium]